MSIPQDSRSTYNAIYKTYELGESTFNVSLRDLDKAKRRVARVCRAFGIQLGSAEQKVLDVGCGLGFYTKALTLTGASVTGLDVSDTGIELARQSFPDCTFVRGAFPDDVQDNSRYHLIWAVDLSLLNTFDIESIRRSFVAPALARLRPGGILVIGWHTNFSGQRRGSFSQWARPEFMLLRRCCGLAGPRLVEVPGVVMGAMAMRICQWLGKPTPIFFARRML
jgi:SAM-dependent methyltransferase